MACGHSLQVHVVLYILMLEDQDRLDRLQPQLCPQRSKQLCDVSGRYMLSFGTRTQGDGHQRDRTGAPSAMFLHMSSVDPSRNRTEHRTHIPGRP